jgi:hypothetical protein
MPIRAIILGPSRSATRSSVSIAVCHSAASCSIFGSAVMYAAASTKRGRGQPSNFAEARCVQKGTDRSICLRLNDGVSNTESYLRSARPVAGLFVRRLRARSNSGRTSAPRLPQAVQTKSGSTSDSRT